MYKIFDLVDRLYMTRTHTLTLTLTRRIYIHIIQVTYIHYVRKFMSRCHYCVNANLFIYLFIFMNCSQRIVIIVVVYQCVCCGNFKILFARRAYSMPHMKVATMKNEREDEKQKTTTKYWCTINFIDYECTTRHGMYKSKISEGAKRKKLQTFLRSFFALFDSFKYIFFLLKWNETN